MKEDQVKKLQAENPEDLSELRLDDSWSVLFILAKDGDGDSGCGDSGSNTGCSDSASSGNSSPA